MEKDTNNVSIGQSSNLSQEALFAIIKDSKGVYLFRRAEKISKAAFLLTQHFDSGEALQGKIRSISISIVEKVLAFVSSWQVNEQRSQAVIIDCVSLISMTDIAATAGLMSLNNQKVMGEQVEIFITEVVDFARSKSVSTFLPHDLFAVPKPDLEEQKAPTSNLSFTMSQSSVPPLKDNRTSSPSGHAQHGQRSGSLAPATRSNPVNSIASTASNSQRPTGAGSVQNQDAYKNDESSSSQEKNERQIKILEIVRQKGEASIKDITEVIKGCSEKTIQRELLSLVDKGILLKNGERRWSRYSIV